MNTIYCELKGYEYQVLGDMNICFFGDIGTEKKKMTMQCIWRRIQAMGTGRLHLDYNLRLLEEYKIRLSLVQNKIKDYCRKIS